MFYEKHEVFGSGIGRQKKRKSIRRTDYRRYVEIQRWYKKAPIQKL